MGRLGEIGLVGGKREVWGGSKEVVVKGLQILLMVAVVCGWWAGVVWGREVVVRVEVDRVLRTGADRVVGVNLNYLRDLDVNRVGGGESLEGALKGLGARWLRFPGGEKSNFHRWAVAPYEKAGPESLEWYASVAGARMDFDQYMAVVRRVGAEPYVVVGFDPTGRSKRSRQEWVADAVAWVRYANVTKGYGVKFWEVGNENWMEGKLGPVETAEVVREFAEAMKKVDPTILVGASGKGGVEAWWRPFLAGEGQKRGAGEVIDFVSISLYNAWEWKGYEYWLKNPETDLIGEVRRTLAVVDRFVPEGKRGKIGIVVAETNSRDYSKDGWAATNTLGHGLVTFETLARLSAEPRVKSAMVWTTRWVKDEEAEKDHFYLLRADNRLTAMGEAVSAWGGAGAGVLPVMVGVDVRGGEGRVAAYATRSEEGDAVRVWVVNRGKESERVLIEVGGGEVRGSRTVRQLAGKGEGDVAPVWREVEVGADGAVECSPVSITVVSFGG